jgi:hypothetical protein
MYAAEHLNKYVFSMSSGLKINCHYWFYEVQWMCFQLVSVNLYWYWRELDDFKQSYMYPYGRHRFSNIILWTIYVILLEFYFFIYVIFRFKVTSMVFAMSSFTVGDTDMWQEREGLVLKKAHLCLVVVNLVFIAFSTRQT